MSIKQLDWQQKLMALLHDAPDKCFDIANHEQTAQAYQAGAGFHDEEYRRNEEYAMKPADWFSSSAERFGFPKGKCDQNFKETPLFIHPLSSEKHQFPQNFTMQSGAHSTTLHDAINSVPDGDWHTKFFLYWRRWLENATFTTPALAYLPADTRIPDHTIWNHMAVTSALAGCIDNGAIKPELLMLQLGPVQDFIAQARTTRDLWSGSYLLSWLIAHALKTITDEIGPDAVIFPSLKGNGIFDALHREEFYQHQWKHGDDGKTQTTWERLLDDKGGDNPEGRKKMADWLLTPTLPNRFLVIVPPGSGRTLAFKAEDAIKAELQIIGDTIWQWLENEGAKSEWKTRWDTQLKAFPQITWATQTWLSHEACLEAAEKLPKDKDDQLGVAGRLEKMIALAENLPDNDKDSRYFSGAKLNNSGILWSAHYALLDAKLAARRNTRNFAQWNPVSKDAAVKDSLSGKEECIGDEEFWQKLTEQHQDIFTTASHRYGAMNLVKRLWCHPKAEIPYLQEKLGLTPKQFAAAIRYDSTRDVARYNIESANPYIAVLAIDGDEMGKWISGAKTPLFVNQLAPKAKEYLKNQGAGELHRLLTPSYHLQFSEALANFAMHKARCIVENFQGDLIYAGGDDVLAILPASRAIACAQALRSAFRTDFEEHRIYPGSKSDLSCGIAVGHSDAPLQMLVQEAGKAEKRAKKIYGRSAMCINLYKRSGEIIEWGCKWSSGALELMEQITRLTNSEKLSARFPYALAALLQPYALEQTPAKDLPTLRNVIAKEVEHALSRQGLGLDPGEREQLTRSYEEYLEHCWSGRCDRDPASALSEPRPTDFLNLFLTETFINRMRGEA